MSGPGHPALTDAATGLPNRLHFDTVYRVVFEAADRGVPLSLMMLDIEGVEEALEKGGGEGIWELERKIADRLRQTTRSSDLLARFDDGTFVVLLMVCNASGARVAADRFQDALAGLRLPAPIGASIGLATSHGEVKSGLALLLAVAEALGRAIDGGGGGVEVASATRD